MAFSLVWLFYVCWCHVTVSSEVRHPKRAVNLNADYIIGGLFPVHVGETNTSKCLVSDSRYQQFDSSRGQGDCYKINLSGLMWVEAMLYATEEINNNSELLPGKTLGFDIRDSANSVHFATNASLDFVLENRKQREDSASNCSCGTVRPVVAVIGGAGSKISKAVGYVVGVEDIPQISYSSTSPSLSDKTKFPSFLRTIPPDYVQAQVMADLVLHFNWSYVSTIATDEDYGRLGIAAFKQRVKARGVCVSVDELFHPDNRLPETKAKIKDIVQRLKRDYRATVVVLFCERPNAVAVLTEAQRQGLTGKTWIGTESWGDKASILPFKDSTVGGMLGVLPWKGNINHFERHMAGLTPMNTEHNPWFKEYWQGKYGCQARNGTKQVLCERHEGSTLPTAESFHVNKAANVMDAVYAVALALHNKLKCREQVKCNSSGSLVGEIKRLTFTRNLGYPVQFDSHGDTKGNYLIKSLQPDWSSPHGKRFTTIGHWDWATSQLHLTLNTSHLWSGWTAHAPLSRCSAPCPRGQYSVRGGSPCCWTCVTCARGFFTNTNGQDECAQCMRGFTSSADHTTCVKLPHRYLRWNSIPGLIVISVCGLGVVATVFVISVFFKFRNSAVVKASTREYTLLMLVILVCLFCLPLLFIDRPTDVVCKVRPVCFGFFMTFWTSLMLTKTNRLLLIFKHKGLLKYNLNTRMQFIIAILLTLVVVAITVVWMNSFPPKVHFEYRDSHVVVHCGEKASMLLMITLAYTAILATISTYFAYKARNLPENFNETRLIGFSMFTFCVVWLTFVPCYYGSEQVNKTMFLCCSLLASNFSALVCMFSPRLRTILFHPERNKTQLVRASMFDYTVRRRVDSATAMQLRRTSVVTVGTFTLPSSLGKVQKDEKKKKGTKNKRYNRQS